MRCEGYRTRGGTMRLGPVVWEQCHNNAVVMLTVTQQGKTETLPACGECWDECITRGLHISGTAPIVHGPQTQEPPQ